MKQAVLLCAGLGTRLRPYTETVPKPMIPILGKPLTEWNIVQLKKYGAEEIFISLYYLADVVKDYFGDGSKWGVKIKYHVDPLEYETAGRLKQFAPDLGDEFFVIYGDILSLVDYGKMEAAWHRLPSDAIGMQRVARTDHYADSDVAELDRDGKFIATHSKPHAEIYKNAYRMRGIFILKRGIFSYIENTTDQIGKDMLSKAVAAHEKFYGYECNDYSKGIDTVEKWKEAEEYLKRTI